jgi:hypothetical protein
MLNYCLWRREVKREVRKVLKHIPVWLLVLVTVLIASPVFAWIVNTGPIANVSIGINKAEASWEPVDIKIGPVDSGAPFSGKATSVLVLENGVMFDVFFEVVTLTDEERSWIGSSLAMGEDTNGDGEIDDLWGSIMLADPRPSPIGPLELPKGEYDVVMVVEGTVGYPEVESPVVDFSVIATVETPTDG